MAFYKYSAPSNTFKAIGSAGVAGEISFDNRESGLEATDVQGAIDELVVYSTTEKVVGRWIDGRPIYRQVIESTLPNCETGGKITTKHISLNASIKLCIRYYGEVDRDGYNFPIPYIANRGTYFGIVQLGNATNNIQNQEKNSLILENSDPMWNEKKCYLVVEYTKTTDIALT